MAYVLVEKSALGMCKKSRHLVVGFVVIGLRTSSPAPRDAESIRVMSENLIMHFMRHVEMLAGKIRERNVVRPAALDAAARYIESELAGIGYAVNRQAFLAHGVEGADRGVVLPGQRWPDESMVMLLECMMKAQRS